MIFFYSNAPKETSYNEEFYDVKIVKDFENFVTEKPCPTVLLPTTKSSLELNSGNVFYKPNFPKITFPELPPEIVKSNIEKVKKFNSSDWETLLFDIAKKNLELDKYLITAIANDGHLEFVLNLLASMKTFGYSRYLIICLDMTLYEDLIKRNLSDHVSLVPSSWLPNPNIPTHESKWESKDYYPITRSKIYIVNKLVQNNFNVLFTDVDIVWLSPNIIKYIDFTGRHKEFIHTMDADTVCTGFYLAKAGEGGKKIMSGIIDRMNNNDTDHDQYVTNRLFKSKPELLSNYGYALDNLLFSNGQIFEHKKLNEKFGIWPMVYHANWLVGFDIKKQNLKTNGFWFI